MLKKFEKRFSELHRKEILEKSQACLKTKDGIPALTYLLDKRGLSDEIISLFGLGFIPFFVQHQLAGRIIFPLYDASGNLIILMTRSLPQYSNQNKLPIYWHETYEKSFYLYGIQNAKEHMRRLGFCLLVEGQFDILQMCNGGIKNVVALCGSTLSKMQLILIHRYCDQIILMLDPDKAGERGTFKAMRMSVNRKCKMVPLQLPNHDPDAYILQHGTQSLKNKIEEKVRMIRKNYVY